MLSLESEFSSLNFGAKLKGRFIKTMKTLSESPLKSIYLASHSRAEAKAIYRMLGNDSSDIAEIKKSHKNAIIERIKRADTVILAVQDTTSVNYNTHKKTEGLGYCCDNVLGINVHSCIAITGDGVVLGVLEQSAITRPESKDSTPTAKKRKRSIDEKESNRWLETMTQSVEGIPEGTKVIHVCDREGDMYELFEKAHKINQIFLIRMAHNRYTDDDQKIIDAVKEEDANGSLNVIIPRNSKDNTKERQASLHLTWRKFNIKKPQSLANNQNLLNIVPITIIYLKEHSPNANENKIEWILGTNEQINSFEEACQMVKYYVNRWKIERFHYVLKSGCNVEKIQERTVDKTVMLMLMYSIIAVFIMNLTYIARTNPDLPCDILFEEQEWKVLFCTANRTKDPPDKPYTIAEAVKFLGWLGGPKQAPSDGPPGVKLVWIGLNNLQLLMTYREWL